MASYLLVRADDHLVVGVRWSGWHTTGVDAAGVPILTASAGARLVVLLPPQHVGEETSPKDSPPPLRLPAGASGGTVAGWRGVLSGGSRVAFDVPTGTRISLSAEGVLAAIANLPLVTSSGVPGADETAIELPWRLLITPRGRSAAGVVVCRHPATPVVSGEVSGAWRTRLVDAVTPPDLAGPDAELALRGADEAMAATPDPTFRPEAPNNSIPLARADRIRVVTETSHQPASVARLELSTLGGTLDATGVWPNFEWEQHAVLGRDLRVRTLTKGAMYPLGHRAQFLEVSERVFDPAADGAAVLRTVSVLTIVEPIRRAPADGPVRRGFPLGDVEITTTTFVDLARPAYQDTTFPPPAGTKPTHFRPTTLTGKEVRFPIRCVTGTGEVRFELPLLFVADLRPTIDSLASPELARRLAADYGASKVGLPAAVIDLVGSAGRANAETHEVHSITVAGVTEGLDLRDGFRPALTELELSLPALRVLRGDDRLSTVRFAKQYLRDAGEDVLLEMLPAHLREIDFSTAADRSGGLVAPKYVTDAISRTLGPISLRSLNPATGLIDPAALFPSDQASLLGFPLKSLLTQLRLPPEVTSIPIPGSAPEVRMRWREVAVKSTGPLVAGATTRLDLDITVAPNRAATVCTLKNFAFELPPGPKRVLRLSFAELTFTQHDGNAPRVDVSGVKAEFLGELKLLEKLQDAVDLGAADKLLDVTTSGVAVRYSLPVPPIAAGVFVMRNIVLSAGIDIPFNGDPVRVALGFASRTNPFQLGVLMFGGGGYVEIRLDRDGLELFEAALEFGAFVAVDFVVASGEVHALGGVRFTLDRAGTVTLTGYLRIGGCIEVLGLIAVSVELCLSMTYHSDRNALVGRATLVIEIDLTLWSDSVEIDSGEWVLTGGGARRHPLDQLAAATEQDALAQWREYRAAFADEAGERALVDPSVAADAAGNEQVRVAFHTTVPHWAGRVVWSPDDRWVIVGAGFTGDPNRNGLTRLDVESGEIRWQVGEYTCVDVAISPDARRVAICTYDYDNDTGRILTLDADTGAEIWSIVGVGMLSFSPDGTLLGNIGTPDPALDLAAAFVLDANTGALLHKQSRCLSTPAFSADSQLLCAGSPALVHSRTGVAVWQLNEHEEFASACVFTPAEDGVIVASGRYGTIVVYEKELADGVIVERSRVDAPILASAILWQPNSIRFSPDRGTVAVHAEERFGLISTADGRTVVAYPVTWREPPPAWSFRPDSSQLAVNYLVPPTPVDEPPPGLAVLDTATGRPLWTDAEHAVADVAFSGDGSRIAVGGADFVRVYEVGRPVRARRDCGARVTSVAASAAAAGVVAAVATGDEPTLTVFRSESGEALLERVHSGTISSLAVSPDGHSAATANTDGRCRHFDTLTRTRWVARHRGPVNAVVFSADSRWLATASNDRSARLFDRRLPDGADPDDHQPRWERQHPHAVTHIAFGPNLAWVATAALDRTIRILAGDTGEELHAFEHDARIRALSVGGTGLLASASDDGSASVIDAETGQRRLRIEHSGPLGFATLSGDGTVLATAGSEAEVHIWRIDGGEAVLVHRLDTRALVTSLAFHPIRHQLAIATEHPVVEVVDAVAGTVTDRLIHLKPVNHLAFGPDGALLATGCEDDHARVYDLGSS